MVPIVVIVLVAVVVVVKPQPGLVNTNWGQNQDLGPRNWPGAEKYTDRS